MVQEEIKGLEELGLHRVKFQWSLCVVQKFKASKRKSDSKTRNEDRDEPSLHRLLESGTQADKKQMSSAKHSSVD